MAAKKIGGPGWVWGPNQSGKKKKPMSKKPTASTRPRPGGPVKPKPVKRGK